VNYEEYIDLKLMAYLLKFDGVSIPVHKLYDLKIIQTSTIIASFFIR